MKLFKRSKEDTAGNMLAEKLAGSIIQKQRLLASFLNGKVQKLSPQLAKALLLNFSGAFGAYCLYLILKAFN